MVRGNVSKLIFIESSVNTHGNNTKIMVPPSAFSASPHERMALTLQSFSIRRNWYNINPTNGIFYLPIANVHYQITIQPGVYATFTALALAINDAIIGAQLTQIQQSQVGFSAVTRKFTILLTMAAAFVATPVQVRCYAIKGGLLPANVTLLGGFNDIHEILGGTPNRDAATATTSMIGALLNGVNTLTSIYPASLNTLDAVYIHCNSIETGNFMSTGHESHAQESLRLIESSLFARIPFDDSTFTEAHEVVSYEDSGGDAFQTFLTRKTLETLDVRITDARGRSLATLDPTQADNGMMGFRMCLRWDLFVGQATPQPVMSMKFEKPPHC